MRISTRYKVLGVTICYVLFIKLLRKRRFDELERIVDAALDQYDENNIKVIKDREKNNDDEINIHTCRVCKYFGD